MARRDTAGREHQRHATERRERAGSGDPSRSLDVKTVRTAQGAGDAHRQDECAARMRSWSNVQAARPGESWNLRITWIPADAAGPSRRAAPGWWTRPARGRTDGAEVVG